MALASHNGERIRALVSWLKTDFGTWYIIVAKSERFVSKTSSENLRTRSFRTTVFWSSPSSASSSLTLLLLGIKKYPEFDSHGRESWSARRTALRTIWTESLNETFGVHHELCTPRTIFPPKFRRATHISRFPRTPNYYILFIFC